MTSASLWAFLQLIILYPIPLSFDLKWTPANNSVTNKQETNQQLKIIVINGPLEMLLSAIRITSSSLDVYFHTYLYIALRLL